MYYLQEFTGWIVLITTVIKSNSINIGLKIPLLAVIFMLLRQTVLLVSYAVIGISLALINVDTGSIFLSNKLIKCLNFKNNFDKIPNHTTIFVSNYPVNIIEYIASFMLPIETCLVASSTSLAKNLTKLENQIIFDIRKNKNFDTLMDLIGEKLKEMSVYVYVENYKNRYGNMNVIGSPLRSGVFHMAQKLGVTITPVFVSRISSTMASIPYQNFNMVIGETQYVTDPELVKRNTLQFFRKELEVSEINKHL